MTKHGAREHPECVGRHVVAGRWLALSGDGTLRPWLFRALHPALSHVTLISFRSRDGEAPVQRATRQLRRTMLPPLWSHDRVGDMVVTCRWSSSGTATTCQRSCALCRPGDTSSSRSTNFPRSHLTRTPASKRPSTLSGVARASVRPKCSGASTRSSSVENRLLAAGDRGSRDVRRVRGEVEPGCGSAARAARARGGRSACPWCLRRPRTWASLGRTGSQLARLPAAHLLQSRCRHAFHLAYRPPGTAADRDVGRGGVRPRRAGAP